MKLLQNPSSFRDPSGHVYKYNNRIIRVIKKYGKKRYEFIKENNLIEESIKNNFLIDTKEIENEFRNLKSENFCYFLEHERLDYISYPYEWGFYQLKEAALHHLKFQIFLLEKNAILIDSSAFNIQFKNNKPIFIDVLSIDEYIDGDYWNGHNQFLQQFLNPLLLSSLKGISFNDWYKVLIVLPSATLYLAVLCFLTLSTFAAFFFKSSLILLPMYEFVFLKSILTTSELSVSLSCAISVTSSVAFSFSSANK